MSVIIRRTILALVLCLSVMFAPLVAVGVAYASKPETPEVIVGEVSVAGAALFGTLNPHATEPREGRTYQFVYRAINDGKCKGAGEEFALASPGVSIGAAREELLPKALGGLAPGTEYAVWSLVVEAGLTEVAVS